MTVRALAVGLLLGLVWRGWAPPAVLTITAVGIIGLTIVFKTALGRAPPSAGPGPWPRRQLRIPVRARRRRSWRARNAVRDAAAMLAALAGSPACTRACTGLPSALLTAPAGETCPPSRRRRTFAPAGPRHQARRCYEMTYSRTGARR
jgi:hypothetical protein